MKKVGSKKRLLVSTIIVITFAFLTGAVFYSTFWLEATATQESELNSILTRENQTIFEPVLPNEHVSLPSDFRFHPEYQHEWWHYFAKLKDEQGKIYNVQWSYFRVATDERET
ncbi:carotenoid 1,2-hydratase, partial [Vibrio parahaemolyticus]|uniref:lipocalin-like domain-containing protein n=1 Tax=Vibrio parahaemolyticus TaxID=670 RepID=UPI001855FB9C